MNTEPTVSQAVSTETLVRADLQIDHDSSQPLGKNMNESGVSAPESELVCSNVGDVQEIDDDCMSTNCSQA